MLQSALRRSLIGAALAMLFAGILPAPPRKPGEVKFPPKSGFYDFLATQPEFESGLGNASDFNYISTTAGQPAVFAGNFRLNCGPDVPHNETSIAINPLNPNNIVGAFHTYALVATGGRLKARIFSSPSVTTDGGATWRHLIPNIAPFQFTGDPAVAFAPNGRVYLASIADHEGQGQGGFTAPSVVTQYSDDGGLTWTKPVVVAAGKGEVTVGRGNGPLVFQDKEFIAVDNSGRAFVTWTSFQEFFQGQFFFARSPITVSTSTNGNTWSPAREISGFHPACPVTLIGQPFECDLNQFSSPASGPGRTYVGFENFNTPAENQYMVVSSSDGGATWGGPSRVDAIHDINYPISPFTGRATLTGCQFRVASPGNVAVDPGDGNKVYAVWADNRNGTAAATNSDVFLARSTNGGATWTVYAIDTAANDQFYPWVAVAPGGRVDVGYMDRSYSAGQSECKYGFSLTRITGFGPLATTKTRVDTGLSDPGNSRWFSGATGAQATFLGDYNGIAVDPAGNTWSLWTDHRAPAPNPPSPTRNHLQDAVAAKTAP